MSIYTRHGSEVTPIVRLTGAAGNAERNFWLWEAPGFSLAPGEPRWQLIVSLVLGAATFALLLATSTKLPMGWDEGLEIHRAEGIENWIARFHESWTAPFSKRVIDDDWRYTTRVEGHPAFYGTVIALGELSSARWLAPLNAARCGPMFLFAVAVASAAYRLWRTLSAVAALSGVAALVTMPRLFAHAHFASFDGPLTSCWLLAWATFAPAMRKRGWSVLWGATLGATMSCKFTGWFAPLPFVFWAAVFGDSRAVRALVVGLAVAMTTFWALNPPLWHEPLNGFGAFFQMNLGRARQLHLNIPTTYFGARYDAHTPLPWHNTLVWTAITVPLGTMALFALGLGRALRDWSARPEWVLLIAHWAVLLIVRATPFAPPHDAERLFLPSFAFLALLAALGCDTAWRWSRDQGTSRKWLARVVVVAALAGSAVSTAWYSPQWLSYYNLITGGLRGADAMGMEATYYWDALDAEALGWLHDHTTANEKIAFASPSSPNLRLMRRWGTLRRSWTVDEPGRYRWYVVQRRASFWSEVDRRLVESRPAAFRKTIRRPDAGIGPWCLDVPIVEVFDYDEFERAARSFGKPALPRN